jgi:hypothetical protein
VAVVTLHINNMKLELSTEYFKHAAHSPFSSSKCRLFHTATFFGSCIFQILHPAPGTTHMSTPFPYTSLFPPLHFTTLYFGLTQFKFPNTPFFPLQGKLSKKIHAILTETLGEYAPLYAICHCILLKTMWEHSAPSECL